MSDRKHIGFGRVAVKDAAHFERLLLHALGAVVTRPRWYRRLWIRLRYRRAWNAPYTHTFTPAAGSPYFTAWRNDYGEDD